MSETAIQGVRLNLPKHKASLTITHNEHKDYYQSVEEWTKENERAGWRDGQDYLEAATTNELWTMQWYPRTPIGFYYIAAPTLEKLLEWAAELDQFVNEEGSVRDES